MHQVALRRVFFVSVFISHLAGVCFASEPPPPPLPLHENFTGNTIPPEWHQDLSAGNKLAALDGQLVITARANTFAHLRRPLGIDNVRITAAIRTDGSANWAPSLFVYWDRSHWTQVCFRPGSFAASVPFMGRREPGGYIEAFGLPGQDMGQFYRYSADAGAIVPKPPPADAASRWHYLGIEIDKDNVRGLTSDDGGKTWTILREMPRDNDVLRAPPKFLMVGKGAADPPRGLAAEDLANDFHDRGPIVESRVKDLNVASLADVAGSPAKPAPVALRDEEGEKILAAKEDPSFDAVAKVFPAMKYGRELLGVKNHPNDFPVLADGAIGCSNGIVFFTVGDDNARFGLEPMAEKFLRNGHVPIVFSGWEHDGLQFWQRAFAHSADFSPDQPISAYAQLRILNPSDGPRKLHVEMRRSGGGNEPPLATWDVTIPAKGEQAVRAKIPWKIDGPLEQPDEKTDAELYKATTRHWEKLLAQAASIDVPEERVTDAYRAWLAWNFINVDKINGVYHPQDNSAIYPAVFGISATIYCRVLDDYGYHDDARRYLESLFTFVQPDGTFIVNYGLPDAGALLTAMAHHYRATGDAAWLKSKAPLMVKIADRFLARRLESRSKQSVTDKWYGMVFEQPYCDYTEKAYNFPADLTLAAGLIDAGEVLKDVGEGGEAERFRVEGEAYRRDLLAGMSRSAIERDGQRIIPLFPQTHALLKASNYAALDYYGLQAGQMLERGLIDPTGPEAKTFVDMLERRGGLTLGMCRFAGGVDHAYTFGYWLNRLQRGEAKKVLLGFYSSLAYGMTRNTYSGVEVTFLRTGMNYPTLPHLYSGSQQLALLRAMLCLEEGEDSLLLCGAIPRPWLADGKHVAASKMSTRFGDVSFSVDSHVSSGGATVSIEPPTRHPAATIRVRFRHPDERRIRSAKVIDGTAEAAADGEYLVLRKVVGPVKVEVRFE